MALGDRIKESTTTTGTGTYDLDGTVSTFQTFISGIEAAQGVSSPQSYSDVPYTCLQSDASGNNIDIEIGRGTLTVGTGSNKDTLTRDSITYSSNGNAAVDWGAGTKTIVCAPQAQDVGDVPHWVLKKTSDQSGIGTSPTKVTWESTTYVSNSGVTVSLANNRVTLTKAGTYAIGFSAGTLVDTASTIDMTMRLYLNGTESDRVIARIRDVNKRMAGFLMDSVTIAANDYCEIYVDGSSTTHTVYYQAVANTIPDATFFGWRVGD